jgi:Co/Zn/Cd efflux system component
MASVWECSRSDIAANLAALVAAAAVWLFESGWPDIVIGSLLAFLFLRSAIRVLRASLGALHAARPAG